MCFDLLVLDVILTSLVCRRPSGLDATAATKLVSTLRNLANAGKTVVAVIHQPSQHVFDKFDDVLLLAEGRLMYYGERHLVRAYMNNQGCRASAEMGTAEHILDCITRDPLGAQETKEDADARMERIAKKAATKMIDLGKLDTKSKDNGQKALQHFGADGRVRAGVLTQFRLLLRRSVREVTRGKLVLFVKFIQQVTTAVIYGGIYHLGTNQASIQDRFGLLSLIAIGSSNMAIAQAIRSFPREKAIVSSELASKMVS